MKNKSVLAVCAVLMIVGLACSTVGNIAAQPTTPYNNSLDATSAASGVKMCQLQNWNIQAISMMQKDLGDGTKDVTIGFGIENNDQLWGKLYGPGIDQIGARLTTTDNKTYDQTGKNIVETMPNGYILIIPTAYIGTPKIPPKFSMAGLTDMGVPFGFDFIFNIPSGEQPGSVFLQNMTIDCTGTLIEWGNGNNVYEGGTINVPNLTFDLTRNLPKLHDEPSNSNYPDLVGSKVDLSGIGTIKFTNVKRDAGTVTVSFSFTNTDQSTRNPEFAGYIIGDSLFLTCLPGDDLACKEPGDPQQDVGPGQTRDGLFWVFTIPETEKNLMLVYSSGDSGNYVFRLNP